MTMKGRHFFRKVVKLEGSQLLQFEANFSPMGLKKGLNSLVIFVESSSMLPSMNKEGLGVLRVLWGIASFVAWKNSFE